MSIATFALAAAGLFQAAPCNLPDKPASFEQDARVDCGWVTVPRSRNDPDAGTLRLWTAQACDPVELSAFNSGVPVNPMNTAFGSKPFIAACRLPSLVDCVRWHSSTNT